MEHMIHFGNADADGADYKGWFVGHFIQPPDNLRSTRSVEVKWGVHRKGEQKPFWSKNAQATTLCILIRGRFRIMFPDKTFSLSKEGDYVIWRPGIPHRWVAEEDSIVLTVRWPSKPDDNMPVSQDLGEIELSEA